MTSALLIYHTHSAVKKEKIFLCMNILFYSKVYYSYCKLRKEMIWKKTLSIEMWTTIIMSKKNCSFDWIMQLIKETYSMVHTQTEQYQPCSIFIALRNFTAKKEPRAVTQMKRNEKDTHTTICTFFILYRYWLLTHSTVQSPSWAANWFAASQEIPHISQNL